MILSGAPPAAAQSILQSIFGFLGSGDAKPKTMAPSALSPPIVQPPLRGVPLTYAPYRVQPLPPAGRGGVEEAPAQRETRYRSLCVRTCDGFYFPVSYGVGRSGLYGDQKICQDRCGDIGELYFHPVGGGSIDTAVNFAGRPYKSLPAAFQYRKSLVSGCACRAAPWSTTESLRHERYAREDTQRQALAPGMGAGSGSGSDPVAALPARDAEAAVIVTRGRPGEVSQAPDMPARRPLRQPPSIVRSE